MSREEIRQKEELSGLLLSSVRDYAIFATDLDGKVISWNEGSRQIHGWREDEILGQDFGVLYKLEDKAAGKPQKDCEMARSRGRLQEEAWRSRKDGTLFFADIVITPLTDATGKAIGYANVCRDLTERLKAEEDLRRSQEIFDLMVATVKDYAIFLMDPDGNILTWNEGGQRIKGYTAREIVGKHFSTFYTQADKERQHPQYELREALKNGHYEEEGVRVRKDGTTFWASVTITPVTDVDGQPRGFIKVTRDLTERKRAETQLKEARDEAVLASKLKSQFVANVSHEVRTPLAGIIGMAEILLLDETLTPDQREAADHIFVGSRRLLDVLNDILDFSKLEAGKIEVNEVNFSLETVLKEVMDSVSVAAAKKGVKLTSEVGGNVPDKLLGDDAKIRQCLLNLAHNAIKFTHKGNVDIRVTECEVDGDGDIRLRFEVKDTGIGVSEEAQRRLFQPFVQADGTIRRKYAGTGLGLSIAKGFVQIMKGDIGVVSEPGAGSTFWFTVPLRVNRDA